MLTTRFKAIETDDIQMELTMRMSLAEWKRLKAQLYNTHQYPGDQLSQHIYSMVQMAETHFEPEEPKPNGQ